MRASRRCFFLVKADSYFCAIASPRLLSAEQAFLPLGGVIMASGWDHPFCDRGNRFLHLGTKVPRSVHNVWIKGIRYSLMFPEKLISGELLM